MTRRSSDPGRARLTLDEVLLLGAIATIRTGLNYFLSQELERERQQEAPRPERD